MIFYKDMIDPFQKIGALYQKNPKKLLSILVIIFLCLVLLRLTINAIFDHKPETPKATVAVTAVKEQNVPVYFDALGTVNAEITVTVRTQLAGTLTHVYFEDGQYVKAGQQIAQIDDRTYQAQLLQYQGALLRDTALYDNARIDLHRYINLYKTRAVSQQTLDTQKALVKQDAGAMKIDQGQIAVAKTDIDYCHITSPVSGRIGLSITDEGNFVQPSDTNGVAVITTLNPIDVIFSLPQDDIAAVENVFDNGKHLLPVEAYNRDQNKLIAAGKLFAIDNLVNIATGTVDFKAIFQNDKLKLFPNEFVNIKLRVDTLKNALVIPTGAIQQGTDGPYVYRYNTNHTVSNIPVKTGVNAGENTVITAGLAVNQEVVTEGADKLFDGEKVVLENTK